MKICLSWIISILKKNKKKQKIISIFKESYQVWKNKEYYNNQFDVFIVVPIEYSIMESQTWRRCCLHQWSKYTFNWEFFSFLLYMFFKMYNWVIFVGKKNLQMVNLSSSDCSDCIFLILCLFSSTSSSWDLLPKAVCHRDFQHFWPMFSQCVHMKQ